MYRTDNPECNRAAQTVEGFKRAGTFVLLTIQQPFEKVPEQMADVDKRGYESRYLWGMKGEGYLDLQKNGERLLATTLALRDGGCMFWREHALAMYAAEITGLGLVKAGFLLQLVTGEGACLDTHNMARFALDRATFKVPKTLKWETRLKKARLYTDTVDRLGGSEYIWDSWCELVAGMRPESFPKGAREVSQLHVEMLT